MSNLAGSHDAEPGTVYNRGMVVLARSRALARWVTLVAVGAALVACTPDSAPDGTPARAESRAASPAPVTDLSEDPCRVRQRHAVQALEYPFQESSERVYSAFSGRSQAASRQLLRRVEAAYDRVSHDCAATPAQMAPFVNTVRRMTRGALDADRLDSALASYDRWAANVGGSKYATRMITSVRGCRSMSHRVHLAFVVREEPAATGKLAWLELVVRNGTDERLHFVLAGHAWVTRRLGSGSSAERLQWGGSSADTLEARPHATTRGPVGIGTPIKLHLSDDGQIFGVHAEMTSGTSDMYWWCSLPVPETHA